MDDEEISQFIDAMVEDYTIEELHDTTTMVETFRDLTGLSDTQIMALLFGAVQVALIRQGVVPDWKQILIQRQIRH